MFRKDKPDDGEWWEPPITRFADPDPGRGGTLSIRRKLAKSSSHGMNFVSVPQAATQSEFAVTKLEG
jgi:hypothetical protein